MEPRLASQGVTVLYSPHGRDPPLGHERVTRLGIAGRIAALRGQEFAGEYDPGVRYAGPVYFVPGDTIIGLDEAAALGIGCEDDLFGAVVPHPFIATKAITHPLIEPDARAPEGWSAEFGRRVEEEVVLSGFTAFSPQDAWRAGVRLLEGGGRLRVKPVREAGGRGQVVVSDASGLEAAIGAADPAELATYGLVLEENLSRVTTHSVGQVRLAGMVASYWGTQRLTPDNGGLSVYGGSDLLIVPGGFDALLATELSPEARLAVAQACAYDAAASECFPGLFASRRNYDIAQGLDAKGLWRSGVLEQSWRIGGASGAEIAALEAFRARPALRRLRASTVELYGGDAGAPPPTPPPQAVVYFCGLDERCGPITKYVTVDDEHADL